MINIFSEVKEYEYSLLKKFDDKLLLLRKQHKASLIIIKNLTILFNELFIEGYNDLGIEYHNQLTEQQRLESYYYKEIKNVQSQIAYQISFYRKDLTDQKSNEDNIIILDAKRK
jgi:6-pyruvoyl-tetrahydropterin synthase